MKLWIGLIVFSLMAVLSLLVWLGGGSAQVELQRGVATAEPATQPAPIRIGLVPEHDLIGQRKRYLALADYLAGQVHRPVKLVTVNSYESVLKDFEEKEVDAAFLGSLVTVLTADRTNARVMLKTELPNGVSQYCAVLCVPENSPIHDLDDLAGRSISMVRTTLGGDLFPIHVMVQHELLGGGRPPRLVWMGTHEEAIDAMIEGQVEVAAVKDLRLNAWQAAHPQVKIRRLACSGFVPENALVVRGDLAGSLGVQLASSLTAMNSNPQGKTVLEFCKIGRFVPCRLEDYNVVYDIIDALGPAWREMKIQGAPPVRPTGSNQR
jgi:phosphonate transport system substrate-binding protein